MENNYNDSNVFICSKKNLKEKINGFIQIPIYYYLDDHNVIIDSESMKEEFERTLYGIESVIERME